MLCGNPTVAVSVIESCVESLQLQLALLHHTGKYFVLSSYVSNLYFITVYARVWEGQL